MVIYDCWSYMTVRRQFATILPRGRRADVGCRERRKADIRRRLFRAALKLFASRGFNATTVEDITRTADVAKGTFFNYFPTKEHLLTSFGEMRLDIIRSARTEAQHAAKPMREVLYQLMMNLAEAPGESRAMARCILVGGLGGEPVATIIGSTLAEGRRILCDAIAIGQRRGEIRRDLSAEDLAGFFQQIFFGVLYRWTLDSHLTLTHCLETTFVFFWAAAEARPPSKPSPKRSS